MLFNLYSVIFVITEIVTFLSPFFINNSPIQVFAMNNCDLFNQRRTYNVLFVQSNEVFYSSSIIYAVTTHLKAHRF